MIDISEITLQFPFSSTHTYTHAHTHTNTHACMHACTHARTHSSPAGSLALGLGDTAQAHRSRGDLGFKPLNMYNKLPQKQKLSHARANPTQGQTWAQQRTNQTRPRLTISLGACHHLWPQQRDTHHLAATLLWSLTTVTSEKDALPSTSFPATQCSTRLSSIGLNSDE